MKTVQVKKPSQLRHTLKTAVIGKMLLAMHGSQLWLKSWTTGLGSWILWV